MKCRSPEYLVFQEIEGFILNVPTSWKIGGFSIPYIRRRHWVAIKKISGQYYLLDSKASEPTYIGNEVINLHYINILQFN